MTPASTRYIGIALGALLLAVYSCGESHIDANVPEARDFQAFMDRDLRQYFDERRGGTGHRVTAELLRDGPTQSGVSYPKFYAWVTVDSGFSAQDRGAVRLAAIDSNRFEITDFLSEAALRADPEKMRQLFPGPVSDRIANKLK